ncbi:hypothetical protein [Pontibacter burrus]|uniref:Uncharacterized protein n=1 Tax=Pontibacter burrus TaxID=2704466 RepID=A0A6B3LJX7_9BACT|nr:hypothetical protein [Pontibacter burrus]NEM97039.1 hypothetical protein [Pontibacter burrus]
MAIVLSPFRGGSFLRPGKPAQLVDCNYRTIVETIAIAKIPLSGGVGVG